jgi:hypothetical protein
MYLIIFIAAFIVSGYLQHTRRVLAGRTMFAFIMLIGFAVSSLSFSDQRWHYMLSAFFTALIIYMLAELYVTMINRFEVKAKE